GGGGGGGPAEARPRTGPHQQTADKTARHRRTTPPTHKLKQQETHKKHTHTKIQNNYHLLQKCEQKKHNFSTESKNQSTYDNHKE
ncbi:hypothetical protein ACQWF5_24950, partial [Salmonella enterica subsp. enterica serovar Infantis]